MFVTLAVVMCKLMVAHPTLAPDRDCTAEETRIEEIVTDSDLDERVDFFACQIHSQQIIADWKPKASDLSLRAVAGCAREMRAWPLRNSRQGLKAQPPAPPQPGLVFL